MESLKEKGLQAETQVSEKKNQNHRHLEKKG